MRISSRVFSFADQCYSEFILTQDDIMFNESFTHLGGWNSLNLSQNNIIFIICIVAAILHFLIWFQLFIHKIKFDITFLFSLGYILTDIFLLSSYFIQYSIRIRSWIPVTRVSCYFEAYFMFYFNLYELYCLTALNICRYCQVVRNRNVYTLHRRTLITSCVMGLLWILINLIIQDIVGWCVVLEETGSSCTLSYTNIGVRIWNMIIILIIPILISFYMLSQSFQYLKKTSDGQMILRRNHHWQLVMQSLTFYSIWLTLWSPVMFYTYLDVDTTNENVQFVVVLLNTLETLADPVISIFLDKRFAQAWKKSFRWINRQFGCYMNARVNPVVETVTVRQINSLHHMQR